MSMVEVLGRLLLALAVVFGLMWVAARGLRRFAGPGRPVRSDAVRVDVLARRGVGKRASVTVVRIGEQTLLLGVTDQSVRLLTSVEAPDPELPVIERVQPAMRAVDGTAALRPSFLEALREKTVRR